MREFLQALSEYPTTSFIIGIFLLIAIDNIITNLKKK